MTYSEIIQTKQAATAHLFFHCCFGDEIATEAELDAISDKLVVTGLHQELNIRSQMDQYQSYQSRITDESAYIHFLVERIGPIYPLALFSYCVELCLTDTSFQQDEESLLGIIARALGLSPADQRIAMQTFLQRRLASGVKQF